MSATRPPASLFSAIVEDINAGVVARDVLVSKTREAISIGQANRVFDQVPHIMDENTLDEFARQYIRMVEQARFCGDNNLTPTMITHVALEGLIKRVIEHGISELLDERGKVKQSLVDLLGWGDLCVHVYKIKLVTAYVGAVMAHIVQKNQTQIINELCDSNSRVSHFISRQYPQWIEAKMLEKGLISKPVYLSSAAGAAAIGAVGVAAVVLGLFALGASAAAAGAAMPSDQSPSNFKM